MIFLLQFDTQKKNGFVTWTGLRTLLTKGQVYFLKNYIITVREKLKIKHVMFLNQVVIEAREAWRWCFKSPGVIAKGPIMYGGSIMYDSGMIASMVFWLEWCVNSIDIYINLAIE